MSKFGSRKSFGIPLRLVGKADPRTCMHEYMNDIYEKGDPRMDDTCPACGDYDEDGREGLLRNRNVRYGRYMTDKQNEF